MPDNNKASMAALRRRMVEEGFLKPTIADIIQMVRPETPVCVLQLVQNAERSMQLHHNKRAVALSTY